MKLVIDVNILLENSSQSLHGKYGFKFYSASEKEVQLLNVNILRNACLKTVCSHAKRRFNYYRQPVTSVWDHLPFQLNVKIVEFCLPMFNSSCAVRPSRPGVVSSNWIRLLLIVLNRQDMASQVTFH